MVRRKFSLVLLILVTIVTLLFGLWPLDFFPENRVRWLAGQDGIQFYREGLSAQRASGGVIYTRLPIDIGSAPSVFESSTIELFAEADAEQGGGLAHVISFHDGYPRSPLVIGQWKSYLIIRSRDNGNAARDTYREIDLRDGLAVGRKKLITIASGPEQTDIYVDGELAKSYDVPALIGVEHFSGYLNLGNSSIGHNAWAGRIYGLALYDGLLTSEQIRRHYALWTAEPEAMSGVLPGPLLSYTFAERTGASVHNRVSNANHLTIPSSFKPLNTAVVVRFWREAEWDWGAARDILVNIVGFTPFAGCLLMFLTRSSRMSFGKAAFVTLLSGAVLSLVIETAQTALPTRTPSSLDILCNTAGALLGILIFKEVLRIRGVRRTL